MRPNLRLGVPIMAIGAALIVAGVLLVLSPWSTEEAAGGTVQHRFCDLVFQGPPPTQDSGILVNPEFLEGLEPKLTIAALGGPGEENSQIALDKRGVVVHEHYTDSEARGRISTILATRTSAPSRPQWWPYSERGQYDAVWSTGIRMPDTGSGLTVYETYDGYGDGSRSLALVGCDSRREITWYPQTDEELVTIDRVQPEDQEAFDTFFASLAEWHP